MSETANGAKKFNLTLARAYTTRTGNYTSVIIGPEEFDALQKVAIGGKLVLKILSEDRRKSEKSPNGYFEYMSPSDVRAAVEKFSKTAKTSNPPEDTL